MANQNIIEIQKFSRQGRIMRLLAAIRSCNEMNLTADKEKIIGTFCLEWSASRRTVMEYIKILESSGKIVINPNGMEINHESF